MRLLTRIAACSLCLALVPCALAQAPALDNDEQKTLYTLGIALSRSIVPFELTAEELRLVEAGLRDGALGREPRVDAEQFVPKIQGMLQQRMTAIAEKEKTAAAAFVSEAARAEGAVKTPSGMVYLELTAGNGPSPGPTDTVELHYHGTLRDGNVFDSSRDGDDPQPVRFALNRVIPCFSEGLQKMQVGGTSRLTCPPDLAYGDNGSPPTIRPGAALTFEVELLAVEGQAGESVP